MLADKIKEQEEIAKNEGYASSGGGDWFKFSEGANKFRVLTDPEMIYEKFKKGICYIDCGYQGTPKFMLFLLDRKDRKIKLAKLPYTVGNTIAEYETNEDWQFEGYPMPYDITVNAKNAGTKEVEYTITPTPKKEDISKEVEAELATKTNTLEIIQSMKDKQKQKHIEDGSWQTEQDRRAKLKEDIEAAKANMASRASIEYPENDEGVPFSD